MAAPKDDLNASFERSLDTSSLRAIQDWVARFSFWIDPAVVQAFGPRPVFPLTRRSVGNQKPRTVMEGITLWKNEPAACACWKALGVKTNGATPLAYSNGHVCHIYNGSPSNPEHFTRLENLVVLPKVLDKFTEWAPVQDLLKQRAFDLCGYAGPNDERPRVVMPSGLVWAEPRYIDKSALPALVAELQRLSREKPSYYMSA